MAATDNTSTHGHQPEGEPVRHCLTFLRSIGNLFTARTHTRTTSDGNSAVPKRDRTRHPRDPPRAYHHTPAETCDPDVIESALAGITALEVLSSLYSANLEFAETYQDGMLAAASFYSHNYVRRAVLVAGISAETAGVAASFLTDYFQTGEGRLEIPEGRLAAGVYEAIR